MAQAASSTTAIPSGSQSAWIARTSAGMPPWWTTMTALVAGVRQGSTVAAEMFCVASSTSQNTGVAPT